MYLFVLNILVIKRNKVSWSNSVLNGTIKISKKCKWYIRIWSISQFIRFQIYVLIIKFR